MKQYLWTNILEVSPVIEKDLKIFGILIGVYFILFVLIYVTDKEDRDN